MKQLKTKKQKNKTSIFGIILCLILLPILVINVVLIIKSFANPNEVPSLGKMVPMVVLTDSMYPEIKSGDLIILNKVNVKDLKVGDIITFFDPNGNGSTTITHRIAEITEINNKIAFKTKGDANNTIDRSLVFEDAVIGIYKTRIPGVGNISMFLSTTTGMIICIAIPLILFVVYDVLSRKKYNKKIVDDREALLKELERLKSEKNNQSNG